MSEVPLIDIRPDHWGIVRDILRKHVPQYTVWAFGSRAKWNAKEYSDLDLAIITDEPLPLSISAALDNDFSESDLPWKVDVVDWATTSEAFRRVIAQDKVVVQTPDCESGWHETTLGKAFEINPFRPLKRNTVTPFVPMDVLPVNARAIERIEAREYTGSGMRFQNGDTLIARITPCLENGKTAFVSGLLNGEVAHGSTEYIVLSGVPEKSDPLFGYYLSRSSIFRSYAIGHSVRWTTKSNSTASKTRYWRKWPAPCSKPGLWTLNPYAPKWKAAGSAANPFLACPPTSMTSSPTGWWNQSWGRFRRGGR